MRSLLLCTQVLPVAARELTRPARAPDTIIPGSENCTSPGEVSRFTRTVYPDDRPCDEIAFELSGGVKPYTVSILVPGTGAYLNATGIDDTSFSIQNTIPAGQTYNRALLARSPLCSRVRLTASIGPAVWVSDSNGSTTYVGYTKTSQLNQPGCNEAIRPNADSGTPVGTVVGAVIGSVLGALLIAAVAWWFVRRRNRQRAEQYRQQPPAATSEFRTADGRAPLVEPFRIPMAGVGAGAGATAAAGVDVFEDHSPNTDSFEKSTYPLSAADQHFFRSAQASAGVLPSALPPPSPHPHAYDPSANPYAHPYDAYDHGPYDPVAGSPVDTAEYLSPSGPATSYGGEQRAAEEAADEAPAGDGTDGLAHPDQFEFRLPGESPTGTGALPWAQQQQSQGGGGGGGAYGHARDGRPY